MKKLRPNNFDLIRLVAALQVIYIHGVEHLEISNLKNHWFTGFLNCFPGVAIFFFISGFMVSGSLERNPRLQDYAVNRFLRIFPGLWVCFAVSIFSVGLFGYNELLNARIGEFVFWCLCQLTCVQFYNPTFLRNYGIGVLNGSLWTIPVELQFYVALPIVYFLASKTNPRMQPSTFRLILVFSFFVVVNQLYTFFSIGESERFWCKAIKCSMLPYFWLFVLGVIFQRLWEKISYYFEGTFPYWIALHSVVLLAASFLSITIGTNTPNPIVGLSLSCTVMSAAFSNRELSERLLQGWDISYGVYIYHMVMVNALISCGFAKQAGFGVLASLFCLTIVSAILSWKLMEQPAIRW